MNICVVRGGEIKTYSIIRLEYDEGNWMKKQSQEDMSRYSVAFTRVPQLNSLDGMLLGLRVTASAAGARRSNHMPFSEVGHLDGRSRM